jgi:hypothetical protein
VVPLEQHPRWSMYASSSSAFSLLACDGASGGGWREKAFTRLENGFRPFTVSDKRKLKTWKKKNKGKKKQRDYFDFLFVS